MNAHDLFGQAMPDPLKRKATPRKGYADRPGTGPSGETCSTCAHMCRFKTYSKCKLMERIWTNGMGSDILQASPACSKWKGIATEL